ncbi:glycoside hydrolase family 26 protein [Mucilaginibacter pallidiroseus]|nr:glycosyl hydrolase [Mucilaginibacter pallidiroseus]
MIILAMLTSTKVMGQLSAPSDAQATNETRELYNSMQRLTDAGIMFGHHDDTAYGVGWCMEQGKSDVKFVTGSYPAVYGWDLAKIEKDSLRDINGIPFYWQKDLVREAYDRGGINTFCWHMDNPVTGKDAWDTTTVTIKELLPGGAQHQTYVTYLDKAAKHLAAMKGHQGEPIPVLFRPFHELTGGWFWWGAKLSTPEEFKSLWQFTINYLRVNKRLHNLLIVFSVADFDAESDFMLRYPGNEYVDFIGFDNYCYKDVKQYVSNLDKRLTLLEAIAAKTKKLTCLAETGYEQIPQSDWWTKELLPVLSKHKLSYVMAWRNGRHDHYYVPYPGQVSEGDFRKFFKSSKMLFQNRVTPLAVYGKYITAFK